VRSDPLQIEIRPGGNSGEVVMHLTGPLTLNNLFDFQRTWREQSAALIMIDLTGVPYVDSAGIGSLVNIHVSKQKIGGTVQLLGVSDRVMTALAVTKVDKVLLISRAAGAAN
jgi:anti-sigma B factor antagonist